MRSSFENMIALVRFIVMPSIVGIENLVRPIALFDALISTHRRIWTRLFWIITIGLIYGVASLVVDAMMSTFSSFSSSTLIPDCK